MKTCKGKNGCGETKPLEEFSAGRSTFGKHTNCKKCCDRARKNRRKRRLAGDMTDGRVRCYLPSKIDFEKNRRKLEREAKALVTHKVCPKCKVEKPRDQFGKCKPTKKNPTGMTPYCTKCKNEYQKQRREKLAPTLTCNNCRKQYKQVRGQSHLVCSPACSKPNLKQQDWHLGERERQQRATTEHKAKLAREARAAEKARDKADMDAMRNAGYSLCLKCGCLPLEEFTASGIKTKRCAECNRRESAEQHRKNPDRLWARKQKRRRAKANDGGKLTKQVNSIQRSKVLDAAGWVCYYCGIDVVKPFRDSNNKGYRPDEAHVDHIIPIAEGGTNETSNLRCSCGSCNLSKGAKSE